MTIKNLQVIGIDSVFIGCITIGEQIANTGRVGLLALIDVVHKYGGKLTSMQLAIEDEKTIRSKLIASIGVLIKKLAENNEYSTLNSFFTEFLTTKKGEVTKSDMRDILGL